MVAFLGSLPQRDCQRDPGMLKMPHISKVTTSLLSWNEASDEDQALRMPGDSVLVQDQVITPDPNAWPL